MKCLKCGADSSVLDTREYLGALLRRRRKCFNGHVFQTFEVHAGNLDRRTLAATVRGIAEHAKAWRLKQAVVRDAQSSSEVLAKRLGVSGARVRQIRKQAAGLGPNGPSIIDDAKSTMAENFLQSKP